MRIKKECWGCKRKDARFKKYWDHVNKEYGAVRVYCPDCAGKAMRKYFDEITK